MKRLSFTISIIVIMFTSLYGQWQVLNQGYGGNYNSIDFVNENIGWIAGRFGMLLKTDFDCTD